MNYTKGELYDRCKELKEINKDLYEASKVLDGYYLLPELRGLIDKALAKAEGK